MVVTLPIDYFLREHNAEFYVHEQIHKKLHFLNELPLVQNETGEFTTYITDANADDVTGDPVVIAEGVEFNEIDFGKPSRTGGSTIAHGFMFKWTDKMQRQGRLNANLQIFYTKAVSRLAKFYDKKFLDGFIAGAGATAPTGLSDWSDESSIDILKDELLIQDAMFGDETGFEADTILLNRNDYLNRQLYLSTFKDKELEVLSPINMGNALPEGTAIVRDTSIPTATIEKYTDSNYSVIRQAEMEAEKQETLDELQFPQSFINIWEKPMEKPGVHEIYMWAEANVNILERQGIMKVNLTGSN